MPKKKEPTRTPVNKDSKKTTQPTTPAVAASTAPVKAEAPKPAAPAAPVKAEAPKPAAPAAPAAPVKAEAPKPAAPAAPVKAEAPKPAGKPAPAKATKSSKASASPVKATAKQHSDATATVIVAKYDVGFGNKLFIRGEGAGLDWEVGVEMKNVENDVWVWTNNDLKKGVITCKFLINDDTWSAGENLFIPAGETSTVFPSF
ncbi:MAG: hypothetical protein P9E67_06520 [Candidatus Competibacter sp.]|nr:hypothetical protein [Candidatus Competibacter sp.]